MKKVELENLADLAERLFTTQGYVKPMWVLITPDKVMFVIADFETSKQKDDAIAAVKKLTKDHDAKIVGFICEAWSVALDASHPDFDKMNDITPSQHPDRREIIQVYREIGGLIEAGSFYILRPEHGKAKLSPFKSWTEDGMSGGRFTCILEANGGKGQKAH